MDSRTQTSKKLNRVLVKVHNAEKEYDRIAKTAQAAQLVEWCSKKVVDRRLFANQIKQEIHGIGEKSKERRTASHKVREIWVNVKGLFVKNNDRSMLFFDEVLRTEKAVLKEYSDVLKVQNLPHSILTLLMTQKKQVDRSLAKIIMTKNFGLHKIVA